VEGRLERVTRRHCLFCVAAASRVGEACVYLFLVVRSKNVSNVAIRLMMHLDRPAPRCGSHKATMCNEMTFMLLRIKDVISSKYE
jgi:hypothetical protein